MYWPFSSFKSWSVPYRKKKQIESEEVHADDEENEEGQSQEDAYTDDFTDTYNDAEAIARVRKIVAKGRKPTKYLKKFNQEQRTA